MHTSIYISSQKLIILGGDEMALSCVSGKEFGCSPQNPLDSSTLEVQERKLFESIDKKLEALCEIFFTALSQLEACDRGLCVKCRSDKEDVLGLTEESMTAGGEDPEALIQAFVKKIKARKEVLNQPEGRLCNTRDKLEKALAMCEKIEKAALALSSKNMQRELESKHLSHQNYV